MKRHITANHKTASTQKLACFSTVKFIVVERNTLWCKNEDSNCNQFRWCFVDCIWLRLSSMQETIWLKD